MRSSVDVVSVVEIDPERRERLRLKYGIPIGLSELGPVLADPTVEMIDVCTPPATHEDIVVASLESGKAVVCEKPLAPTLQGIDRIREVARRKSGRVSTVHQYRMIPELHEMVRLRNSGELGDLLYGQFTQHDRASGGPIQGKTWWGDWHVAGGGVGMTQFIHLLDLMCLMFGRPLEVTGMMATLAAPIASEDTLSAIIRFEEGAIVAGAATMTAQRSGFRIDVTGSRGSVHYPWGRHSSGGEHGRLTDSLAAWRYWSGSSASPVARGVRRIRSGLELRSRRQSSHSVFLRHVVDAIQTGDPLPVPPDEARRAVELCTAIYASALSRNIVALPLGEASPFYAGVPASVYSAARESRDLDS
jgi:predicted dehydrogenase